MSFLKFRFFKCYFVLAFAFFAIGCRVHRPEERIFLKDKVVIKGNIVKVDSLQMMVELSPKESRTFLWEQVDSIQGIRFPSLFIGYQLGYAHVPYFSMFRNESIQNRNIGFQLKLGRAVNGNSLRYLHFSQTPGNPFQVRKWGWGFQRYMLGSYLGPKSIFAGADIGLMKPQYNNGNQLYLEPFIGWDYQWNRHLRAFAKCTTQWNVLNRNPKLGWGVQAGLVIVFRDFNKHYQVLNQQHRLWYK